jgi:septal ring factor EnvC (AmiA/AmiB activator)
MNSTPNAKTIEPDDVLIARADEQIAHAYEQIARADEQIARVNEQVSKLEHDAARNPSALGRLPSRGRPTLRALVGLLLAACIFVTAFVSQSSHGDAAKLIIARWAPQLILTSSLPMEKPGLPAQPSPSAVQVAAAEPVAAQPTPLAQIAPQDVAPTAAPVSPEVAQLLQTMARDLANVEQAIEQLRANQEQMATDNAKAVAQLKASQEQMTRLIAKASEQNLRPKTSAPPPRPIASPTRKPVPKLPSPQARAQPQVPMPLQPDEQ